MLREKWLLILAAFVAVAGSSASGQQESATAGYVTKSVIEKPAEKIVARNTAGAAAADVAKTVRIEKPASTFLAHNTANATTTGKEFVNPKVEAGRVHWHPSLAVACEAAKKSGKPILLFQMMGKLDDQFC